MRVLMFGWEFPPHISGGLGTACQEITRALTRRGVKVVFVVPQAIKEHPRARVRVVSAAAVPAVKTGYATESFLERLEIRPIASLLRPYLTAAEYQRTLLRTTVGGKAPQPVASILATPTPYSEDLLAEVARFSNSAETLGARESFDVIHAHDWMTFLAGIRAKRVSGKPLVVHIHSLEYDRTGDHPNPDIVNIEKLGMDAADHVIAVSHYTRQIILDRYGIDPAKVSVIHNAVSSKRIGSVYHVTRRPDEKIVLFLGRVTLQKGPDYFVEAAARVLSKMPDVTFVMAGSGDMLPRLIERVGELRIGNRFHFTGFLQGQDVERMYAMSDVYVMPSVSEPFGISPLEAMLYDVPVIVSRHAGVGEVIRHSLKVDFWDIDDIADKIIAVLKYPALSRELLGNGKRELKAVRWNVAAGRMLDLYKRLAAR